MLRNQVERLVSCKQYNLTLLQLSDIPSRLLYGSSPRYASNIKRTIMNPKIIWTTLLIMSFSALIAQDSSHLFFTTGVGTIRVSKGLSDVFKPTVAFNSGLELNLANNWFAQLTADLNSFRYDQQLKDANSPYLIRRSNSTLFMGGFNGGKNFSLMHGNFISLYLGSGYLTVGEPRVVQEDQILRQNIYRHNSIFARTGGRFAFISPIKFLQVLYLDINYWTSKAIIQNRRLEGYSFFIGSRMGM